MTRIADHTLAWTAGWMETSASAAFTNCDEVKGFLQDDLMSDLPSSLLSKVANWSWLQLRGVTDEKCPLKLSTSVFSLPVSSVFFLPSQRSRNSVCQQLSAT